MSDLRTRFRSLDDLRTPDLWAEIEARATVVRPVGVGRLGWVLIGAVLLLTLALAGAVLVGSGIVKWPVSAEASPRPSGSLEVSLETDQQVLIAWPTPGYSSVSSEVIVALRNTGQGWVHVDAGSSTYTILNKTGASQETGNFRSSYPETIGPGAIGYLFAENIQGYQTKQGITPADFATVTVKIASSSVGPPASTFVVSQISWRKSTTGLTASAMVTTTGQGVPAAELGVVCIGKGGKILGVTFGGHNAPLRPGTSTLSQTPVETPPLTASQCASSFGGIQPVPVMEAP